MKKQLGKTIKVVTIIFKLQQSSSNQSPTINNITFSAAANSRIVDVGCICAVGTPTPNSVNFAQPLSANASYSCSLAEATAANYDMCFTFLFVLLVLWLHNQITN